MVITLTFSSVLIFIFCLLVALSVNGRKCWYEKPVASTYILGIYLLFAMAFSPKGGDKLVYLNMFEDAPHLVFDKDLGWVYLTKLLYGITLGNSLAYLFILAFIYIVGYYIAGLRLFGRERVFYLMIFSVLFLGFWSGGTNIMRAGIATSFFLISLVHEKSLKTYLLFSCLAISIHSSLLLLVFGFWISRHYNNCKSYYIIWFLFVVLSFANVFGGLTSLLASSFGSVSERLSHYAYVDKDNPVMDIYKNSGFRIDFILYSAFPLLYSWWIIFKRKFEDPFFIRLVCTYIMSNCLWLVVIRIPYADRFAMLSWSLMCLIILYPFLKKNEALPYDSRGLMAVMIPILMTMILLFR